MKPQRVIIAHGFNVSDNGAGTTARLAAKFREDPRYEVTEFETGERGFMDVRLKNPRLSQELARLVKDGDIIIGHSDGCNLIDKALHAKDSLHPGRVRCVYLNPALDRDTALSGIVDKCLVFHTESDKVVLVSKYRPFFAWGEMGMKGYRAVRPSLHDPRYRNISYESLGHHQLGHSGVFKSSIALNRVFEEIEDEFMEPIPKAIPIPE